MDFFPPLMEIILREDELNFRKFSIKGRFVPQSPSWLRASDAGIENSQHKHPQTTPSVSSPFHTIYLNFFVYPNRIHHYTIVSMYNNLK